MSTSTALPIEAIVAIAQNAHTLCPRCRTRSLRLRGVEECCLYFMCIYCHQAASYQALWISTFEVDDER